ncbi:MAG: energy transducer TonB [Chitinophagaceae bacterium]|nr:energy transducer TonB [Chitinophagaceae bacterium]
MQTNKILSASLLDLVFDGRNKDYGAYDLRITYPERIKKSLFAVFIITALAMGGVVLASSAGKHNDQYRMREEMLITEVKEKEKEPEKIVEPEKPKEVEEVKMVKSLVPEIKPDEDVPQPPPSQDDMKDAVIGDEFRKGRQDDGIPTDGPTPPGDGSGIIEAPKKSEPEPIFTSVEVDAKFKGNWKAFLEKNLNAEVPVRHDAPPGRYSVVVRFVVDLEGNVSDIQPLTEHGYGMEDEAVRVLRKATKWDPAYQNGYQVKAYKKQVIIFEVLGEE